MRLTPAAEHFHSSHVQELLCRIKVSRHSNAVTTAQFITHFLCDVFRKMAGGDKHAYRAFLTCIRIIYDAQIEEVEDRVEAAAPDHLALDARRHLRDAACSLFSRPCHVL